MEQNLTTYREETGSSKESAPTRPKGSPLDCPCGKTAKYLGIVARHGRSEQIACECGRHTRWLLCGRNGEHRTELLYLWGKLDGAEQEVEG